MMGGLVAELLDCFFPADKNRFYKMSKDGAESRFHGGIHFRIDKEVGLDLGRKVAGVIVQRLRNDGADTRMQSQDKNSRIVQASQND